MTTAQSLAEKGAHIFTCGYENSSRYTFKDGLSKSNIITMDSNDPPLD